MVKWVFQAYLAFIVLAISKINQIISINRVRTLLTECGILREGFVSGGWAEVYGLGRSQLLEHWTKNKWQLLELWNRQSLLYIG